MGRIERTIELAKASWRVLQKDRELMWLPVMSFAVGLVVLLSAALVFAVGGLYNDTTDQLEPLGYVLAVVVYMAMSVITVFFNAAVVHGAFDRFRGGDPTVRSSLDGAWSRLPFLVPWALLTATVGLVLRALEERAGTFGRIVVNMIGAAWSVVTFLVVPVLLEEEHGPVDGVKRSASLFKTTWGENIAAQFGFGLVAFLAVLPGVVVGGLVAASGFAPLVVLGVVAIVIWVGVVMAAMSAMSGIFQAALYRYAVDGQVPDAFAGTQITDAFGQRRR